MSARLNEKQTQKRDWIIEQMNDYREIDLPLVEALAFAIYWVICDV